MSNSHSVGVSHEAHGILNIENIQAVGHSGNSILEPTLQSSKRRKVDRTPVSKPWTCINPGCERQYKRTSRTHITKHKTSCCKRLIASGTPIPDRNSRRSRSLDFDALPRAAIILRQHNYPRIDNSETLVRSVATWRFERSNSNSFRCWCGHSSVFIRSVVLWRTGEATRSILEDSNQQNFTSQPMIRALDPRYLRHFQSRLPVQSLGLGGLQTTDWNPPSFQSCRHHSHDSLRAIMVHMLILL